MGIYIVSGVAIICCILTGILCRRYVLKVFNSIETVLDRMLMKDTSLRFETTDENRISKLKHKANRILDMYVLEAEQTKEEKDAIQGFISDMSHQMRTPLSGISMYADLLLEDGLSVEEQQEFMSRIKFSTEKLQWLMDNLIKMSRLEVGAIQLVPEEKNIRQTISEAIGSVITEAVKKNINITVLDFEDRVLFHDRKWTREVIVNLLENAIKYSEHGSEVEVSIEILPLYTKLMITDYGMGIDKNDWNMIFKRFYRSQNAKDIEGTGLGLYLAELIMEKQGGYIMVDSVLGKFTTFSLFLQNCKK